MKEEKVKTEKKNRKKKEERVYGRRKERKGKEKFACKRVHGVMRLRGR